jgi:hypothetical protein
VDYDKYHRRPREDPQGCGILQDDVRRDNQISRVPSHSWEEVIRDISLEDAAELAERIVGIKQDDYELVLGFCGGRVFEPSKSFFDIAGHR